MAKKVYLQDEAPDSDFIRCPHCNKPWIEADTDLIDMFTLTGSTNYLECPECGKEFKVVEVVERSYEITKSEEEKQEDE